MRIPKISFGRNQTQDETIRAIVIDAPHSTYDDNNGIYTPPESYRIPRRCLFRMKGQQTVILVSIRNREMGDLIKATGKLTVNTGKHGKTEFNLNHKSTPFYFMNLEHIYKSSAVQLQGPDVASANQFLEKVASGELWQQPEGMTPVQFGSLAQMKEVTRQANKHQWRELINKIDSSMKWLVFALLGAILLALLLKVG